jgi:hypothetical protein
VDTFLEDGVVKPEFLRLFEDWVKTYEVQGGLVSLLRKFLPEQKPVKRLLFAECTTRAGLMKLRRSPEAEAKIDLTGSDSDGDQDCEVSGTIEGPETGVYYKDLAENAVRNIEVDVKELQKQAVRARANSARECAKLVGEIRKAEKAVKMPNTVDKGSAETVQILDEFLRDTRHESSRTRCEGIMSSFCIVIPVFLDSAERAGLIRMGLKSTLEPNMEYILQRFPHTNGATLQRRPELRGGLLRKDAVTLECPTKSSTNEIRNLVVSFDTSTEADLARLQFLQEMIRVGCGSLLDSPCFLYFPEYPTWRQGGKNGREYLDKVFVRNIHAKDIVLAVRTVTDTITKGMGQGYIESNIDAARYGDTYTVFLLAYGLNNARAVVTTLTKAGFMAYGSHEELQWCKYCEQHGHSSDNCTLPRIMIRTVRNLNQRTIKVLSELTEATHGYMGAVPNTSNAFAKKFGFFVYRDVGNLLGAAKTFKVLDGMGAFQAVPRMFQGPPEMCARCGLLRDEADGRNKWHMAGDDACQGQKYIPHASGHSSATRPRQNLMDVVSGTDIVAGVMDALQISRDSDEGDEESSSSDYEVDENNDRQGRP